MTIKYPSIAQFKNLIRSVKDKTRYQGKDEQGNPIYNDKELPTLKFVGTVKVHGCFEKNTPIMLANGEEITISQISVGDSVLSYDVEKKSYSYNLVKRVFNTYENKEWCKLKFDDREIVCTKDHKFWTTNRGWVEAQNLTSEDIFIFTPN